MSFNLKHAALITVLSLTTGLAHAAGNIQNKRFGDWGGNCQASQQSGKVCYLEQTVSKKGVKKPLMVTVIGYAPGKPHPTVIIELPNIVDMPKGVHLMVDQNEPVSFKGDCNAKGCRSGFALDAKMTRQFKKGRKAVVAFTRKGQKKPTLLPISLMGVTAGLNALR